MSERPKALRLTEAAAARVKAVMANAARPCVGLRVGVKNAGCAGQSYTMEFAEAQNPFDEVVEDKGVKILIDPKAILFLIGTELDYKTGTLTSGFVFNNPNEVDACGCGESVNLVPAGKA